MFNANSGKVSFVMVIAITVAVLMSSTQENETKVHKYTRYKTPVVKGLIKSYFYSLSLY